MAENPSGTRKNKSHPSPSHAGRGPRSQPGRSAPDDRHHLTQPEAVLASIQDGLLVLDADWCCTYANEAAATFLKSTPEELLGQIIWEALPQARGSRFYEESMRAAQQNVFVRFEEYYEPLGRWYECRCYPGDGGLTILLHDTTGHKQVEEALVESRQVLEMAIAGSNAGVWRIDLDPEKPGVMPDYVYISPQLKALIGFADDEFPNARSAWFGRIPPEDVARMEESVRAHAEGRTEYHQVDFRIRHKDGSLRWLSTRGRLYRDEFNRPVRWAGIDWDITDRKLIEEEAARARQEWERTFDAVPDLIAIIDPQHRIVRANRAMAERLGMTPEKCAGSMCYECFHGLNAPPGFCPHAQTLADGHEHTAEVYEEHLDSHFLITCTPLFDPQGRLLGSVHLARDITERKKAEEALRQLNEHLEEEVQARTRELRDSIDRLHDEVTRRVLAEDKLRKRSQMLEGFFRHTITPLAFMDKYFTFVRVNAAYAQAAGQDPEFFVGKNHFALYPDAQSRAIFERVVQTKQPYHAFARPFDFGSGNDARRDPRYWNWLLTPLTDELGEVQFLVFNLEDVTERQKAFSQLEERARQLQQLTLELSQAEDRERKRLAEVLHDDLQQMLAAAKFHLGLLSSRVKTDDTLQELAGQIKEMLQEAINKSRSLSHELRPPGLSHGDLYETFEWLAQQIQAKHGLTVHLHACERIELQSESLKALLYKAAQEMLFNVIKHAKVKEARLHLRRRRGCIYLSVSDRGRGFDPRGLGQTGGFGLLSIRERVKLLGGRMKVRSIPGRGSVFLIAVPAAELQPAKDHAAGEVAPAPAAWKKRAKSPGEHTLRVLLVDDHKIVREGLQSMLVEERDIEVVGQAGNGREAIDLAHQFQPDVVVMDVAMPVMGGDEATRQIKRHLPDTRVVALSMFDDARIAERMRKAGAAAYLLKTAPSEELLAAIRGV